MKVCHQCKRKVFLVSRENIFGGSHQSCLGGFFFSIPCRANIVVIGNYLYAPSAANSVIVLLQLFL
jgi:hypothetical protein